MVLLALAACLRPLHVGPLDLAAVSVVLLSLYYIGIAGTDAAVTLFGLLVIYSLSPLVPGGLAALLFLAGGGLQVVGYSYEANRPSLWTALSSLLLGPLWLGALTISRRV